MEDNSIYNFIIRKSNWVWHTLYWLFAIVLMFFIFSNQNYDPKFRIFLVGILTVASFCTTIIINNYVIPKYLFAGKIFMFFYILFAIFIVTLWLISFSVVIILGYSVFNHPFFIIPQRQDILTLVVINYLVVVMAVVIHFIKESYRRLIEKNSIEKQKQLTELKLKEANLKLLQGQVHPHFLFNMLNNLYGMVKEDVDNSREIIVKLSDLLDHMLYECEKPTISLSKEIKFIIDYIELERVRHDKDFNVHFNYQNDLIDVQIVPLVLFPFVENAFKHGFNDPKENFIKMNLKVENKQIIFHIENSLAVKSNDKYLNQESRGIGLKNIKERLKLIYKENYNLEILDNENTFIVNLKINIE